MLHLRQSMVGKRQQEAIIGGMLLFVLYFATLPVVTGAEGWNDTATYATLYKTLVPLGIAIGTALVAFGDAMKSR
jgi:hypothetical protein